MTVMESMGAEASQDGTPRDIEMAEGDSGSGESKGVNGGKGSLGKTKSSGSSGKKAGASGKASSRKQASETEGEASKEGEVPEEATVTIPFVGKMKWSAIKKAALIWLSEPMNIALLLWIVAVAVAGGILFLTMTGMLNAVIPDKTNRQIWGEACNQVLTALFTLYCLLVQPWRIVYLIRVIRWEEKDRRRLRIVFSRAGPDHAVKNEHTHMAVVAVLLNMNNAFQYALAGVMWGISWEVRSGALVGVLLAGAIGSVAAAGLYTLLSPLGRPKPPEGHMTLPRSAVLGAMEGSQASGRESRDSLTGDLLKKEALPDEVAEGAPIMRIKDSLNYAVPIRDGLGWDGPLLGFADDWRTSVSVLFCFCCSFGRNLSTAGFGNRYLHAVMLFLFLVAPFLICEFAALQVDNRTLAHALIAAGVVLSYCGLLYGGYWRTQLSKVFRLPTPTLGSVPCGAMGDCLLWVSCCFCALCQEIRTVEQYGLHVDFDSYHEESNQALNEALGGGENSLPSRQPSANIGGKVSRIASAGSENGTNGESKGSAKGGLNKSGKSGGRKSDRLSDAPHTDAPPTVTMDDP